MKLTPGLWAFYARKQIAAYSTAPGHALLRDGQQRDYNTSKIIRHRPIHSPFMTTAT